MTPLLCRHDNGTVMDRAPPGRRRLRGFGDYVPDDAAPPGMAVKEVAVRFGAPPPRRRD